jgi:pyruvate kinase
VTILRDSGNDGRICRNTEQVTYRRGHFRNESGYGLTGVADAMAFSIAGLSERLDAKYIIAFTYSGKTAVISASTGPACR